MTRSTVRSRLLLNALSVLLAVNAGAARAEDGTNDEKLRHHPSIDFTVRSARDGK